MDKEQLFVQATLCFKTATYQRCEMMAPVGKSHIFFWLQHRKNLLDPHTLLEIAITFKTIKIIISEIK